MLESIRAYWLRWGCGLAAGGILAGFRCLIRRQQAADARQNAVERGMQALLRDRLVTGYYHYKERGSITLHGLEAMELMYAEYGQLGGNGTVTRLMEDMRDMEVRDK